MLLDPLPAPLHGPIVEEPAPPVAVDVAGVGQGRVVVGQARPAVALHGDAASVGLRDVREG